MRKDRNCTAYANVPMNGPMMMPYPMIGPLPMGMPNPTQTSCSCSCDNNGELLQLKQQINNLERRVSMLENKPTPYHNNNYDSNVQMI